MCIRDSNNGTIVAYTDIQDNLSYSGSYDFQEFDYANFSGVVSAKYNSTNQMIFNDGSEGTFNAGDSIILGEGFWAKSGSTFTASLVPSCTPISINSPEPPVSEFDTNHTNDELHGHQHKDHYHALGFDNIEAFPNPFSETATIQYTVKEDGPVTVSVFDINGKQVTNLVDSNNHLSGEHRVEFEAGKLPTGVYHCRMITKDGVKVIALSLSR